MNTPDAKDTRIRTPTNGPKRDRSTVSAAHASWKSRGKRDFHTAFASALKRHRCEKPLRVASPPTGWVTALAGLLAHGSSHTVRPSRFPSGHFLDGMLTAYSCGGSHGFDPPVGHIRVPSCLSGANRRTSADSMIHARLPESRSRRSERTAPERHKQPVCCWEVDPGVRGQRGRK